jgi:hypothetical protein
MQYPTDTIRAIRLEVEERDERGRWPVTITFESGNEQYRLARDMEAVEGLRAEFGLRPRDVLFRGRSRIELGE